MRYTVIVLFVIIGGASLSAFGQMSNGKVRSPDFEITNQVAATTVKNQQNTNTCWSYSCSSFLESEMMRMGKEGIDLSEMYAVRKTYSEKATSHVRYHGKSNFDTGSLGHDVLNVVAKHGMVPESAYSGKKDPAGIHDHKKMHAKLAKAVKKMAKENKLSPGLFSNFEKLMDIYMGEVPASFSHNGKQYDPRSFADEVVGINPDDYISLTSFSHRPFYKDFVLEVPDNFSNGAFYNLPLEELVAVADHALSNGYSICWDGDISHPGFDPLNGIADHQGEVTQVARQQAFDSQELTDDHLMHITGLAKGADERSYYVMKNSWGAVGAFEGIIYTSKDYFRMNTISILVHKDAIPKEIALRLKKE